MIPPGRTGCYPGMIFFEFYLKNAETAIFCSAVKTVPLPFNLDRRKP